LAVRRGEALVPNPPPEFPLRAGDQLALIGEGPQLAAAESFLAATSVP
jgi:K+/H+ antiporter YhaU regulatory subunit KhtT